MNSNLDNSFSREKINYSMVWEDESLLLNSIPEEIRNKPSRKFLSIGSAGCNSFALLTIPNTKVFAIDLSQAQIALIKLKKIAIKELSHESYLKLFQYTPNSDSLEIYQELTEKLDAQTHKFWAENTDLIKSGIIHSGRLELYFSKFREKGLSQVFSKNDLALLLENDSLSVQKNIIEDNMGGIKKVVESFFNRDSFSKEGRSQAHYKFVSNEKRIEKHITQRALEALNKYLIKDNRCLHYIFKGSFSIDLLPFYAQEKNFNIIKNNLSNFEVHHSDIEGFISKTSDEFDFYNLSDIFEYVSEEHYENLLLKLRKSSSKEALAAYWNLFVDRSHKSETHWRKNLPLSEDLTNKDSVWFYQNFNLLEAQ